MAGVTPQGPAHCCLCAQPFAGATSSHLCGACLQLPPRFTRVHAACRYRGSIKDAVHILQNCKPLGLIFGKVVTDKGTAGPLDYIVPVPLHPHRLRRRGYNQALEIATTGAPGRPSQS